MDENQSPERIFHFLKGLGFGFNNQRGMLEHCRDGKNLLKIISEVLKNYEPAYLRSIIAVESHGVSSNLEKHRDSLPIIADFLVAKSVFKITNFTLELRDFLTLPQPLSGYQNKRMAILSHLYAVWNWMKEVHTANELGLGRLARLQNDHRKLVEDETKVDAQTEVVNRNKVMEKPTYDEKMRLIAEYKEKLAQQRSRKNELAGLKVQKDKDLIDKTNEIQLTLYRTQQVQIEISQARRELSINAPEVRKEKLRQDAILMEVIDRKTQQQKDIENLKDIISKKFSSMENSINKLKGLAFLDALEVRSNNLKAQSKKLKRREDQRREAIQRLEAQLAKMESEVQTEENKQTKDNELILQLKFRKFKAQQAVESKKNELGNLTKGISEILAMKRECSTDIQQMERKDLEECNQYEQEMRRLTRQVHEWNKNTFNVLCYAHSSFNMGFFDKSH